MANQVPSLVEVDTHQNRIDILRSYLVIWDTRWVSRFDGWTDSAVGWGTGCWWDQLFFLFTVTAIFCVDCPVLMLLRVFAFCESGLVFGSIRLISACNLVSSFRPGCISGTTCQ